MHHWLSGIDTTAGHGKCAFCSEGQVEFGRIIYSAFKNSNTL